MVPNDAHATKRHTQPGTHISGTRDRALVYSSAPKGDGSTLHANAPRPTGALAPPACVVLHIV
jgi:hypothetical protein